MTEKINDPYLIMAWIRKRWSVLKNKGQLEQAIAKFIKISKQDLTVQDVIDIEESIPEYLNK